MYERYQFSQLVYKLDINFLHTSNLSKILCREPHIISLNLSILFYSIDSMLFLFLYRLCRKRLMMMNFICGMIDWLKGFSLNCILDLCKRLSLLCSSDNHYAMAPVSIYIIIIQFVWIKWIPLHFITNFVLKRDIEIQLSIYNFIPNF